jgi:hypothetical protein
MIRFLADASLYDAIVTGCLRREPCASGRTQLPEIYLLSWRSV